MELVLSGTLVFLAAGFGIGLVVAWNRRRMSEFSLWIKRGERFVVFCLLPLHLGLTQQVYSNSPDPIAGDVYEAFVFAAIFGAALPILVYGVARRIMPVSYIPSLPLAAASFGGGNRGVILISVLALLAPVKDVIPVDIVSSQSSASITVLDQFIVMDYAYFLVLAVIAPVHFLSKGGPFRSGPLGWHVLAAAIAIALIVASPVGKGHVSHADALWFRAELGHWLALLSTALVFAQMSLPSPKAFVGEVFTIFAARAIVLAVFFGAAYCMYAWSLISLLEMISLGIPFVIFLLLPPSSYIGPLVAEYGATEEAAELNRINGLWNLLIYLGVAMALFFASAAAWGSH